MVVERESWAAAMKEYCVQAKKKSKNAVLVPIKTFPSL